MKSFELITCSTQSVPALLLGELGGCLILTISPTAQAVAYAEMLYRGGFIQCHMVDICIWCALFVTSPFDVIIMFPKQRFAVVC